ncbi:type III PLP-dependent enzyme [Marinimicrococcus flavescens]|uniref:ornithine decarboxylase n=1 Tax=Marinimicrococcus flavescens TaxID=3031815 RepID=A0AAP3V0T3_9PROT|nr:type III PLP-dependent enzyme [Marinimicrococcus flavescens]
MADTHCSAAALLARRHSKEPVVCVRPHLLEAQAERLVDAFPGDVLYAVKCNDTPLVLQSLWNGGVRHFDTASINEIRLVRTLLPEATCHFMHPVKSTEAIAEAYFEHGVKRFVLDHVDELTKIVAATDGAEDLELFVRLAVPGQGAMLSLTGKFGVEVAEAVRLVRAVRWHAKEVGLTFHVGSQCVDPQAYRRAIDVAAEVVAETGSVDHLDVGGGFPALYKGDEPEFEAFVAVIETAVAEHGLVCRLQCEPGRALVADGASVLTKVELRRGRSLYLNDGVYGNLAELKWIGPQFPTRLVRPSGEVGGAQEAFDLFGPTCDSIDSMPGPHWIAAEAREGDWVEVGMMGAYSSALKTAFNGFEAGTVAILHDDGWYLPGLREPEQAARAA